MNRNVPWPDRPSVDSGLRLMAARPGPGTAAAANEAAALMRVAIAALKDADRDVILLRGYDDLGFRETRRRPRNREDGSVRFVWNAVDSGVWQAAASINAGEAPGDF